MAATSPAPRPTLVTHPSLARTTVVTVERLRHDSDHAGGEGDPTVPRHGGATHGEGSGEAEVIGALVTLTRTRHDLFG